MPRVSRPRCESDQRRSWLGAVVIGCGFSLAVFAAGELPPQNLQALPHTLGQIRVTWTNVPDEDGFVLERKTETGIWIQVADTNDLPPDSTQYVDAPGPVREKFSYRVASSHAGGLSPWSDVSAALPVFTNMPLYGWLNVTDYGSCTISGVTNPHPIQCAIHNDLGGRTGSGDDPSVGPHALYFPDGEYLIDQTLFLEGRAGIQFVGESPSGVILKWTGGTGSSPEDTRAMFHAEGNRDSTWRNFVWDGNCVDPNNCFVVAFDQSFCGRTDLNILRSPDCSPANLGWPESGTLGLSDVGGAHIDSVFKNAFVGLRLGHYGVADDTTTVRRCQFVDDFVGVSLEDWNALNHTFWDSLFQDNFAGISNDIASVRRAYDPAYSPGICQGQTGEPACFYGSDCDTGISCVWTRRRGGDFDLRRGRFSGNAHTDIWADPTGDFIIRDSWASGSGRFFFGGGLNGTPGRYTLLNNTVWDTQGLAIETKTPGTFLFADNAIYTDEGASESPVVLNSLLGFDHPDSGKIDLIAVDNVYTNDNPYDFKKAFRLREFGDQTTSTPPPVSIPPLPTVQEPLNGRPVYTVTDATSLDPTANAARIQHFIDAALADPQPAIVHLPGIDGRYQIDQTLQIPASADVILTGDGKYTVVQWVGGAGQPILQIDAAQVDGLTIRDLHFLSGGIVVENLSQDSAHGLFTQLRVAQSSAAGVLIEDLDEVKLNLVSFAGEHGLVVGPESVAVLVKAGPVPIPAQEKPGVAVWSSTMLKHHWDFLVLNDQAGAKVLISGNYMEKSDHHLRVQGDGTDGAVMVHGAKIATTVVLQDPTDPVEMAEKTAAISIEDFPGNVSVVETTLLIVAPDGGTGSSQEAFDYGPRIRVLGNQLTDVDVEAMGTTLRRQPSAVDPNDPTLDLPEYDLLVTPPSTVDFLRLSGKRAIPSALQLPDIHADEIDPQNPDLLDGSPLTAEQETQVFAGLELLRTMQLPAFYDESGASDPQQINFDRVFIFKASPVGLVLSGGISCSDPGDCVDGVTCTTDSCDLTGLPANVPGQCRFVPEDSLCDDGDACTTDSCDPLTGCSHDPISCDDGLFCNGVETCDPESGCQGGPPVDCGDSVACTTDSCNEATDTCDHLPDDGLCDNGLFCDGADTCDVVAGCQTGNPPCGGYTCNETTYACDIPSAPRMEAGTVAVGGTHMTVPLVNAYASPVIVGSVQYAANTVPIVARVSNVTSVSFDVRFQNPSSGAVAVDNFHYLVVEEGIWTIDGLKIEAWKYTSTVTDENNSWVGEAQAYGQSYTDPVVLGHVMSENDSDWSVFWCRGGSRTTPPSSTTLHTGKTVCGDPDATREDETIGVVVLEAGTGTIGGVAYETDLGADKIRGAVQNPPYAYTFSPGFATPPTVSVATMAGMDASDGGWAQTHGPTAATEVNLFLSVDEDQLGDSERSHTHEQVGYAVFGTAFALGDTPDCTVAADCDDGEFCNGPEGCVGGVCQAGATVSCDDSVGCTMDLCNETTDSCDNNPDDGACDNGQFCDGAETCDALLDCQSGTVVDCDDGVGCTTESCNETSDSCDNTPVDATCDNGLFCDGAETCDPLLDCQSGTQGCDDGVGCTTDSCNEATDSCVNTPDDNLCDNGLFCDGAEICDPLLDCQSGAQGCDDGIGCTADVCNETTDACDYNPDDSACDDDLFCNGAETCDALLDCQNGTVVNCDDGVGCTTDSCNETSDSCDNTPVDASCDNDVFCDGAETCDPLLDCQSGTEVNCNDGVGCTTDSCNETADSCDNTPVDATCDNDVFCDGAEICDPLLDCQSGTEVNCNDGVGCTTDSCNETADSCDNTPVDATCDNGLFCDGVETCDPENDCQSGTPVTCDDGVGCTTDACNETTEACDSTPDDSACDNGAFCDGAEICDAQFDCQPGTAVSCQDSVACTIDSCNESTDSCDNAPDDSACDNGEFCDGAEACDPVNDCQSGVDPCPGQTCDEADDTCESGSPAQLEAGTVSVGGAPTIVTLTNTYVSAVVVCSVQYSNNTTPVVARVTNVTSNSFEVRLQNPSDGAVVAEDVSYIVVEEGVWTIDGVAIEAQTYNSTVTDEDKSWNGEAQGYGQSYTSPVVLGQVMTENDPAWSVFWCRGGSRASPPSASALRTGKTVCEDDDVARMAETIGFIVVEAGGGTIDGIAFEAAVGTDTIRGVGNSPPYAYSFSNEFSVVPTIAIHSMAGMDGLNGGWSQSHGPTLATKTSLFLSVDEDQLRDSERRHGTEQVGYLVFESAVVYP